MRKGGMGWGVMEGYGGRHAPKVTPCALETLSRAKKLHCAGLGPSVAFQAQRRRLLSP